MPRTSSTSDSLKPSILDRSGLDITLEAIQKNLDEINHKLDNAPTREKVEELERSLMATNGRIDEMKKEMVKGDEFKIVRGVVFTFIGLLLLAFAAYIFSLVPWLSHLNH